MKMFCPFFFFLVVSLSAPTLAESSNFPHNCFNSEVIPVSQALERGFLLHRGLPLDFFDQNGNTYTAELEEDTRGSPKTLVAYSNNRRIVEDASLSLEAYVVSRIQQCLANLSSSSTSTKMNIAQSTDYQQAYSNNLSQSNRVIQLESELAARDEALGILRSEYESAKARVRNCRGEHGNRRGSTSSRLSLGQEKEQERALNVQPRSETKAIPPSIAVATFRPYLDFASRTEVELRPATKSPPQLAPTKPLSAVPILHLTRINNDYAAATNQHSKKCKRTLDILAKRLSEMTDFLAHLFALEQMGTLDFSGMSESTREHMHRSMDDGRRLSQTLQQTKLFSQMPLNDEDYSSIACKCHTLSWNIVLAGLVGGIIVLLGLPICLAAICCWIRRRWTQRTQANDVELGNPIQPPHTPNPLPALQYDFPVGRLPEAVANN